MDTGLGGPQSCDKAHGNPCAYCRLSAIEIATRFTEIGHNQLTLKELRQFRKIVNKMGYYDPRKKPNN